MVPCPICLVLEELRPGPDALRDAITSTAAFGITLGAGVPRGTPRTGLAARVGELDNVFCAPCLALLQEHLRGIAKQHAALESEAKN